jgi:hypothetical protein
MVEDPDPETELGLKPAVAPAGSPETVKLTFPLKPFAAATFIVKLVLVAGGTFWEAGVAVSEKFGCTTTSVTGTECVRVPVDPVIVSG